MKGKAAARPPRLYAEKTCPICDASVRINNYNRHHARCQLYGKPVDLRKKEFRVDPATAAPPSALEASSADLSGRWMSSPDTDRMLSFWEDGDFFRTDMGVAGGIAELAYFLFQEDLARNSAAEGGMQVKAEDGKWTPVQAEASFFTILINKCIDLISNIDKRSDRQLIFFLTYRDALNERNKLTDETVRGTVKTRLLLHTSSVQPAQPAENTTPTLEQLIAEGRLDDDQMRKVNAVRRMSGK